MIKPRHIFLAIKSDDELNRAVGDIMIPMSGAIEHMEPEVAK